MTASPFYVAKKVSFQDMKGARWREDAAADDREHHYEDEGDYELGVAA